MTEKSFVSHRPKFLIGENVLIYSIRRWCAPGGRLLIFELLARQVAWTLG